LAAAGENENDWLKLSLCTVLTYSTSQWNWHCRSTWTCRAAI